MLVHELASFIHSHYNIEQRGNHYSSHLYGPSLIAPNLSLCMLKQSQQRLYGLSLIAPNLSLCTDEKRSSHLYGPSLIAPNLSLCEEESAPHRTIFSYED